MTTRTSTSLRFAALLTAASGFLDAYTYVSRDGVFANAQTGNVILLGIDLSDRHWHGALAHVWPILAFVVGVAFANLLESTRAEHVVAHPIRLAVAAQVVVLVAVGFVPVSVPDAVVTVPIAFVAAMQIGLFRTVGTLSYIAIATTGNLMRFTEAAYAGLVDRDRDARRAAAVYAAIIASFAGGAVLGAVCTRAFGGPAAWIPAGLLGAALVLFYLDER
ncbi:YoaK family protein [Rhodococcus olei]|uniref:YoaK family protein n=1 Tax=Rhodococcus olei TaxID=2161675 RepID=A0ABP8PD70_9NOCA